MLSQKKISLGTNYLIEYPPSTGINVPVTKSEAEEAKNIAVPAKSSGTPHLPAGILEVTRSASFGKFFLNPSVILVVMYPGRIELT